jgi:hypothetical protein
MFGITTLICFQTDKIAAEFFLIGIILFLSGVLCGWLLTEISDRIKR